MYLYDVLTNTTRDLPMRQIGWAEWTTNGRFLLYGQRTGQGRIQSLFAYEVNTQATSLLVENLDLSGRNGVFALSSDGRHLAVDWGNPARVYEIERGTKQFHAISPEGVLVTNHLSWSPLRSQLVYGATDIPQEVTPSANYFFLFDHATSGTRELLSGS